MGLPRVKLGPLATGQETLTPSAGQDGLKLLVPVDEPLSVGAPPVAPSFVRRASSPHRVRSVATRSGHRATCPRDTAPRVTFEVGWIGLSASERTSLRSWLAGMLRHGVWGFDLKPDGSAGSTVVVRPTGPVAESWRGETAFDLERVTCEEVY